MEAGVFVKPDSKDLGTEPIARLLFRLSLPSTIGMIVMASYNIVDTIFIGRGVGHLGIAAVAICFPVQMIASALAVMGGAGGASIISRSLGAGDIPRARRAFGTAVFFAAFVGLAVSVLVFLNIDNVLRLFGASPAILPHAEDYLSVILLGIPIQTVAMVGNHAARAEGNAKISMVSLLISGILNTILDPVFIFWFGWGVKGAAAATVLSQIAMFLWISRHFRGGRSVLRLTERRDIVPSASMLRETVTIGLSEFTRMASGSLSMVLVNAALARWGGDMYVAIYGIIHKALSFFFFPLMGIAQGFQPILGYNYGARNLDRARRTVQVAIASAMTLALLGYAVIMLYPGAIIRIFSTNETLVTEGVRAMRLNTMAFFVVGFQVIGATMFQALGKARPAFLLSLSRQVLLLIPLILVLPKIFGTDGVWISFPLADTGSFCLTFFCVRREIRRLRAKTAEI